MANKKANMTVEDIEEALKKMQKELDKILNKMKGSNSTNSNLPSSLWIFFPILFQRIRNHVIPEKKVIVTEVVRQNKESALSAIENIMK